MELADIQSGMLVLLRSIPVIVVEVKTTVNVQFEFVNESDVIEMLIYCLYLSRRKSLASIIGCLTDGNSWHILRMRRNEDYLTINQYLTYTNSKTEEILSKLPKLLKVM